MNIHAVRSDNIYKNMMTATKEEREDLYRNELMAPFGEKWACYRVPLKADVPGGYDAVSASAMLGALPPALIDESQSGALALLSREDFWSDCTDAATRSLARFIQRGIPLPVKDYRYTVLLAQPENPSLKLSGGYYGDGGIPGYVMIYLTPRPDILARIPCAIAHEMNHNVRFQFIQWHNDVTLGEMMVSEGLAESFAVSLYGEELLGPWVAHTDTETLNHAVKPALRTALEVRGMQKLSAYLYGDEIAGMQNAPPVGMPYCAGYACGYHLIQWYLAHTNRSVEEATLLPAQEILRESGAFWESDTEPLRK